MRTPVRVLLVGRRAVSCDSMSQLTRSITDRLFVGLLSALLLPVCAFFIYARLTRGNPAQGADWTVGLLLFLVFECIGVVLLGSVLGIIWALWTPDWLERRLKHTVGHFVFLLCAFGFVLSAIVLYTFARP